MSEVIYLTVADIASQDATRLSLAEVPPEPLEGRTVTRQQGPDMVIDATIDGHPCRWRYDSQGLKAFFRYHKSFEHVRGCPWVAFYER